MPDKPYAGPDLPSILEIKDSFPDFRLDVPDFCGELDPHQHIAVACSHIAHKFLNMDKVGLGKTIETIGLIAYHMSLGIRPRWVIIVESSHLFQWRRELSKFLDYKAVIVRGTKARRRKLFAQAASSDEFILLATYGSVRVDFDLISAIPKRNMAYDEAALLANENATHRFAIWLNRGCEYVITMSAEPVTRGDPTQLNMIFKTMGSLLMDEAEFERKFCIRKDYKVWVRGRFGPFRKTITKIVGVKNAKELKTLLVKQSIRRGDSVLPKGAFTISRHIRSVAMTPYQRDLYSHLRKGVLKKKSSMTEVEKLNTADYITQVLASPWVNDPEAPKDSPKLQEVVKVLQNELSDERVVLFCRHLRSCQLATEILTKNKIPNALYTGEISSAAERDRVIQEDFVNGDARVLVVSGAAARGLDGLQKVSHNLFLLDVVHSPAFIIQLIGRLARRGQLHRVINVFFFMCDNTVETSIMEKLHDRQSIVDRLYDEERAKLFSDNIVDIMMEML